MKYISDGTWFKKGTEAKLIDDYRPAFNHGLFEGIRVCENPESEGRPAGQEYEDEEICSFNEFEIKES